LFLGLFLAAYPAKMLGLDVANNQHESMLDTRQPTSGKDFLPHLVGFQVRKPWESAHSLPVMFERWRTKLYGEENIYVFVHSNPIW